MQVGSIKTNLILSTAYQFLTLITPFITAPYIARILGADGVGIASYTGSIEMYFSLFAALGTASYGMREIARVRNNQEKRSQLFWEIQMLAFISTLICLVLWFLWISFVNQYQLYYVFWTMTLAAVMFDISWLYMGLEQFQYIVYRNAFFKILGVIALFLFVRNHDDVGVYIAITSASTLLGNISMWYYIPRFVHKVDWRKLSIRKHFKETLIYFLPTVATSIYTVLDKTLLGVIIGSAVENGYYEQTTKIIRMAQSLTFSALNNVLGARISFLFAEKKFEEIHERIRKSMDYIFFMGFGMTFGIIGIADVFVPWFFGTGYGKVVPLLQMMSPIILIIGVSNCLGSQYYNPAGLRKTSARFIIIGSIVNLALNLILIPRYESYGTVLGSLAAESIITILYFAFCGDYLTLKILMQLSWRKIIASFFMLVILKGIYYVAGNGFKVVISQIIAGGLTYIIILYVLKDTFVDFFIKRMILGKIQKLWRHKING